MKKSILVAAWISACMVTTGVQAEERGSNAEGAGLGIGGAIGGVLGGPVGFIAGAAIGAAFGDKYHQAKEGETAKVELLETKQELSNANEALTRSLHDMESLQAENRDLQDKQELITQLRMEILFHTGDSNIDETANDRLQKLAALINTTPGVEIRLDGYADPRGDEEFNLKLSGDRADTVKQVLVDAGVDEDRIRVFSHGEDTRIADEKDLDALALTRRVTVKLHGPSTSSVAQSF
ncbi:MAG: OmpA family protein [Pseudomonadota bacterium]